MVATNEKCSYLACDFSSKSNLKLGKKSIGSKVTRSDMPIPVFVRSFSISMTERFCDAMNDETVNHLNEQNRKIHT